MFKGFFYYMHNIIYGCWILQGVGITQIVSAGRIKSFLTNIKIIYKISQIFLYIQNKECNITSYIAYKTKIVGN